MTWLRSLIAVLIVTVSGISIAAAQEIGIERCFIPDEEKNIDLEPGRDFTSFLEPDEAEKATDHPFHPVQLRQHPLFYSNLFDRTGMRNLSDEEQLSREWQTDYQILAGEFEAFVRSNRLDDKTENMKEFEKALSAFLTAEVPDSGDMRPVHNDRCEDDPATESNDQCGLWGSVYQYNRMDISSASLKIHCADLISNPEDMAIYQFSNTLYNYAYSRAPLVLSKTANEVSRVYLTHKNRLDNGLPMWPWETFANGLNIFDGDDTSKNEARTYQWIVARPSIAPALRFSGVDDSQLDAALMIEPVGMIWYEKDSEFKKWKGASLMVSITNDNGVGYGGVFRVNQWLLGAARHSKTDEWLLYVSVDLYDLVVPKDRRSARAQDFLGELKDHLVEKAKGEEEEQQ